MALKKYKPTSPGRRFMLPRLRGDHEDGPEKSLLEPLPRRRAEQSRPHHDAPQGGGHKRLPDDRLQAHEGRRPAKVAAIEYDPNRSARIALLHYADGAKSYILAPARYGSARRSSRPDADISRGTRSARQHPDRNARPCGRAQAGSGRSHGALGGSSIQLVAKDGDHACCGSLRVSCGACS